MIMTPLDILKADLCGQIEYTLSSPVIVDGVAYAAADDDRAKFAALRAVIEAGGITGSVTLKDASGGFHAMPSADASAALLAYGSAYYARWVAVETVKSQINGAHDEATARAAFAAWKPAP